MARAHAVSFGDDVAEHSDATAEPPIEGWPAFAAELYARLVEGRRTYGEASLRRPPGELVGEIRQELLDVCGWSFILARRLELLGQARRRARSIGRFFHPWKRTAASLPCRIHRGRASDASRALP
jgi:hypothetical protein